MLISNFEEIKILKDDGFNDFYAKLNNIVYSRFNLIEKVKTQEL